MSRLRAFVQWLLFTSPAITDTEQKRQSQLLAAILFVVYGGMLSLAVRTTLENMARNQPPVEGLFVTIFLFLNIGMIWLNRRGHYLLTARMLVATAFVGLFVYSFYWYAGLIYLSLLILVAALFLPTREVLFTSIMCVAAVAIFALFFSNARLIRFSMGSVIDFVGVAFPVVITYILHRRFVEAERRRVLQEANDALRASEALLERRVEERTQDLRAARDEAARLYQEQVKTSEQLRQLDQLKSQFLASISHELRTPLNAILNFTEFVSIGMMGPVNERQTDALNKALDSGRHLLSLINDVLDITKIEAGMLQLFIEEQIDLEVELRPVIETTQAMVQNKPVELITEWDTPLPRISGDRRRIRQILLNLLSNAVKFTDSGTVTFRVMVRDSEIQFMVADTGPGIPKEQQQVIFEPFVQSDAGIRHAGGTGLGLPISLRLTQAHGGRLWVESEPGAGSTFFVTLPLPAQVAEPAAP